MGMNTKSLNYFYEILKATGLNDFKQVSVCILGNQIIRPPARNILEYDYRTFKRLLVGNGFGRVESIDLNGKDNSLVMDLSKPITQEEIIGAFDVVVNGGVTEHVLHNQWQTFRNIHDLLKPFGVVIHLLLPSKSHRGHGFWSYNESFFIKLARACLYEIVDIRIGTAHYTYSQQRRFFVAMQKKIESKFIDKDLWHDPLYDEFGLGTFLNVMGVEYDTFIVNCLENKSNG